MGPIRKTPFAFTEHGVAILSSKLNSEQAIQVNIQSMLSSTVKCRKAILRRSRHEKRPSSWRAFFLSGFTPVLNVDAGF